MTIFYEFVWDFGIEFVSINSPLTILKMTFHWIRVYLPFEVGTTHHWCSNSICPQGRHFATTFWTLHRVFTRPWQKSVARVHRPVASASGIWFLWARCLESWVLTLDNPRCFVFPPLPHPVLLTSIDDYLIHPYDELAIVIPIGHFLMVHLLYPIRSGTSGSQITEFLPYDISRVTERKSLMFNDKLTGFLFL